MTRILVFENPDEHLRPVGNEFVRILKEAGAEAILSQSLDETCKLAKDWDIILSHHHFTDDAEKLRRICPNVVMAGYCGFLIDLIGKPGWEKVINEMRENYNIVLYNFYQVHQLGRGQRDNI